MLGLVPDRVRRAVKSGGPPALVTAGIGVGATAETGPLVGTFDGDRRDGRDVQSTDGDGVGTLGR